MAEDDDRSRGASAPLLSRRAALRRVGATVGTVTALGARAGCAPPGTPQACLDHGGDQTFTPAELEATEQARALLSGVDHLLVLMFENRSFDHMLGALRMDDAFPDRARVEGITGQEWNPDRQGRPVRIRRMTGNVSGGGPERAWKHSHTAFNEGRMDGFVASNDPPKDVESMLYYDRASAPLHYALCDRYTVCDRWFASVLAATWPNRYYLHAATSNGRRLNLEPGTAEPSVTVWERMAERCRTAKNYYAGNAAWYSIAFARHAIGGGGALVPERIGNFFRDAREGTLPDFAIIDPDYAVNDMHPPHTLAMGEAFLGAIVRAVETSPQWARTMLVVTYDENGGFYDHVLPPRTVDPRPDFCQLGFRVPAIVIGPQVWQGKVISTPLEHVSIAATLRTRFGIRSLGPRMDAASDLSSCIDPARVGPSPTADTTPRLREMPPARLERDQVQACCGWTSSQEEMVAAVLAGEVPETHLDVRPTEERMSEWLQPAEDLGVIRLGK